MAQPVTVLPIHLNASDRRLLEAAAQLKNLRLSTYLRATGVAAARLELELRRARAPEPEKKP